MPVQKVDGGYRWGTKGKIYRGKDAKEKAARQGRAIKANQQKGIKKNANKADKK